MDHQENLAMKTIYLENHGIYSMICKYNTQTGDCVEVERDSIKGFELWRGFYTSVNGKLVGVYASQNGPVLFSDQCRYLLEKGKVAFSLTKVSEVKNVFTFMLNDQIKIKVEYSPPQFIEYDNWSTEEMVDFFVWLAMRQESERFYKGYTLQD